MNQPTPPRPDVGTILEQWDAMVARVQQAELDRVQTHELNIKLVAETEIQREQIDKLTAQLSYYRDFGIAMSERAAMIGDVVEKTLHEAKEFARNAPHRRATIVADKATIANDLEGEQIRGILERIPHNNRINGEDNRLPRAGY